VTEVDSYEPDCPLRVRAPIMLHRWETLTFLHWSYQPNAVARLLPAGLTLETFDGRAWVGLVPFYMRVRWPGVPEIPWASRFCETNVRTYVRDSQGRSGIWFFSLDAARAGAVLAARAGFALPYMWSRMSLVRQASTITYRCRRQIPGPVGTSSLVTVRIGEPFDDNELTDRDHFLTARWRLFSIAGPLRMYANAEHARWPLYRAEVRELDDSLVRAAGLPQPEGAPLVHYSPGVDVRIGRPRLLRR